MQAHTLFLVYQQQMGGTSDRKNPSACARQAKSQALYGCVRNANNRSCSRRLSTKEMSEGLVQTKRHLCGNPNTIAACCATFSVEEKHVIEYLGHLNDINIRKDIRTREAKEKKRLEEELTYKDYQWGILIENGKVEKLKVRQLDLYLKEHGLTTVGIKLDKIKAIRYHYYRQRSPGNGNELSSSEEESEESDTELDDDEDSEDDLVIADLDEQSTVRMPVLTFVPDDQIAEVTVQANTG